MDNRTKFKKWVIEENKERGEGKDKPLISTDDFDIVDDHKIVMGDKIPREHIQASVDAILKKPWCKELILIIGGVGNYRNDISETYKSSRGKKPERFIPLREWVIKTFNPTIKDGVETDDVVAWRGWESYYKALLTGNKDDADVVSIHIDKDLDQFPGWHYKYSEHGKNPVWISPLEALRNFYVQMLLGDKVDCIEGLPMVRTSRLWFKKPQKEWYGCGKKTAKYLIDQCSTEIEMLQMVEDLYKDWYYEEKGDENWMDKISVAYQLLKLMEYEGVLPDYYTYRKGILNNDL